MDFPYNSVYEVCVDNIMTPVVRACFLGEVKSASFGGCSYFLCKIRLGSNPGSQPPLENGWMMINLTINNGGS